MWTVGYIETKPGHFDDYIEDLNNVWRRYLDEQKKDGDVLSYSSKVCIPECGHQRISVQKGIPCKVLVVT